MFLERKSLTVVSSLPFPKFKSRTDLFLDYCTTLEEDFPVVTAMADQIFQQGQLAQWVVLTPVLATTDTHHLARYVENYLKQEKISFTVVLFPNASLAIDPKQEAVKACVAEIQKLQKLYPTLDLRYVTNPRPAEKFTSIGALRRLLWDAATLASSERKVERRENTLALLRASQDSAHEFSSEEVIQLASALYTESVFFNHDVDLISLPADYLWEMAWQVCMNYFFAPKENKYYAFSSKAEHGRVEGFPHTNAVVAFYDYLIGAVGAGFEASLVIPAYTYTELGGFSPSAYTYEVAGFVARSSTFHVPHVTLTTDQRRFNSKLHDTSISLLWGEHSKGTAGNFSEDDACREDSPHDISAQRRDELILQHNDDSPVSDYIIQASLRDTFQKCTDEEYVLFVNLSKEKDAEKREKVWYQWEDFLRASSEFRMSELRSLLSSQGFSFTDDFCKKISNEVMKFISEERTRFLLEDLTPEEE